MSIPVAFYAPLKSPDDPTPSGDRTMARLLMRALDGAGFAPHLASDLRTFDPTGDGHPAMADHAREEAEAFVRRVEAGGERPALWFTYHVYYKAPDWIGPRASRALGIPYVVAEGSRAAKRSAGPHAFGHRAAEAALDAADLVLSLTRRDALALEAARPAHQRLVDLPPFLDLEAWPEHPRHDADGVPRLLAIGMLRPGDKLASYALLAQALGRLATSAWRLIIAGDGPGRGEIEGLFAPVADRVRFVGRVDRPALAALCAEADCLVWPAVNEAYGMALLEAQAQGVPVVAGGFGGVPEVVLHGRTGLVTEPGDVAAFAAAVDALLADPRRRRAMGRAARDLVRDERGLPAASARLVSALGDLLAARTTA